MARMALGLAYDGADWLGWQTQPNRRTVQDTLEAALARFVGVSAATCAPISAPTCTPIHTTCAGRTDAGVHAAMQVVHFDTAIERTPDAWVRGVNAHLPASIAVRWARAVPDHFHARFAACSRSYVYLLYNARTRAPFWARRAGWCYRPLDIDAMRAASQHLTGEHDFSSFRSSQCQAAHPVRTLQRIDWRRQGDLFIATFTANAFLHHMVRNLMGALVYVGLGRLAAPDLIKLLAARNRRLAPPTYAPDGLYLAAIGYPGFEACLGELDGTGLIPGIQ